MNCELCSSAQDTTPIKLRDESVVVCRKCDSAIEANDYSDTHHWHCLNEAIWSERSPVKILSYRILHHLSSEPWAIDLREQIYLEDEDLSFAQEGLDSNSDEPDISVTKDSNGAVLQDGDSVTLIKDLDVKGAGFTAKRGTLVKGIKLTNNPDQIDARVNGIQIVLLTKYLKKV